MHNHTPIFDVALTPQQAAALDAQSLAFVGDALYHLYVRKRFVLEHVQRNALSRLANTHVCATAQARALDCLLPMLTPEEADIFRRARNVKCGSAPRNAKPGDYHKATGLEALVGYLYLSGAHARAQQLLCAAYELAQEGTPQ